MQNSKIKYVEMKILHFLDLKISQLILINFAKKIEILTQQKIYA